MLYEWIVYFLSQKYIDVCLWGINEGLKVLSGATQGLDLQIHLQQMLKSARRIVGRIDTSKLQGGQFLKLFFVLQFPPTYTHIFLQQGLFPSSLVSSKKVQVSRWIGDAYIPHGGNECVVSCDGLVSLSGCVPTSHPGFLGKAPDPL